MYELEQVSEKCDYMNCPAKIGVYAADKTVGNGRFGAQLSCRINIESFLPK